MPALIQETTQPGRELLANLRRHWIRVRQLAQVIGESPSPVEIPGLTVVYDEVGGRACALALQRRLVGMLRRESDQLRVQILRIAELPGVSQTSDQVVAGFGSQCA